MCKLPFNCWKFSKIELCSSNCREKFQSIEKIEIVCKQCGILFYDWKSRHRTYCSGRCSKLGKFPWNTGKKMSKEHCEKLSKAHIGKLNPHIGVPKTEETRKKISDFWKTHKKVISKETRLKHSKNMIHKMKTGIITNEDTLPERLFENQLLFNNILYVKQYKYDLGIADFWLPETNTIVECDGIYWHSKPVVKERDLRKNTFLTNAGYKLFRFTDKEILENINKCVDELHL